MRENEHQRKKTISAGQENASEVFIPISLHGAAQELRIAFELNLNGIAKEKFIRIWASIAYLFPNLHPDGYESEDSGWPRPLRRFAAEAWRRLEAGEMSEIGLYQSDAQWCGIYDRLKIRRPDEISHRIELAGL